MAPQNYAGAHSFVPRNVNISVTKFANFIYQETYD